MTEPMKIGHDLTCIPHEWRCPHHDGMRIRPWLCEECTVDDAWELYRRVNQVYRDGSPVMIDKRFDLMESLIRERWPKDRRFWKVGETK